jgi:uncharacterized protein YbjT (DUF2867 family)
MKILILGATGFIGSTVAARLLGDGHAVAGLSRNPAKARIRQPSIAWIKADLAVMTEPTAWRQILDGCDIVVNSAGALQDGLSDDLSAVQERAMLALYAAAKDADLKLLVQISARTDGAGSDRPFLATKRNADRALVASGVPHVILRPALVIGRNAHGGTALLRALAALPLVVPIAHASSPVETVAVDDVAAAVSAAVAGRLPPGGDIDLAADEALTLADLVGLHRRWLGLPAAPVVPIPGALARPVTWLADLAGRLGWRSPLRSTAMAVMSEGVVSRGREDADAGFRLATAAETLTANPSAVQDLWFARLYLLKAAMIGGLSLFWLLSGLVPLLAPVAAAAHFLPYMPEATAIGLTIGTCLLDIALALAVLLRPLSRIALYGMIGTTLAYLAGGTLLEPSLWLDPLGPLVKTIPSILLTLATLAILEER